MPDSPMIGRVGRVTGAVRPGHFGEVMIAVRGGIEAFYAVPADGLESIPSGAECVVVDYQTARPRTVLVTAMPSSDDN